VEYYFKRYGDLELQRRMVADRPRTDAFAAAIREVVRPTDVVLDVGTGTGILAMLAARAGARKVYAVDQSDIADAAARGGLQSLEKPLMVYVSSQAHSSVEKAALLAGFGRENLRVIPVDENFDMLADELVAAITQDTAAGLQPCAIVATCGTSCTKSAKLRFSVGSRVSAESEIVVLAPIFEALITASAVATTSTAVRVAASRVSLKSSRRTWPSPSPTEASCSPRTATSSTGSCRDPA
jgi:16S rRNA G966 N2-methylase RsmD